MFTPITQQMVERRKASQQQPQGGGLRSPDRTRSTAAVSSHGAPSHPASRSSHRPQSAAALQSEYSAFIVSQKRVGAEAADGLWRGRSERAGADIAQLRVAQHLVGGSAAASPASPSTSAPREPRTLAHQRPATAGSAPAAVMAIAKQRRRLSAGLEKLSQSMRSPSWRGEGAASAPITLDVDEGEEDSDGADGDVSIVTDRKLRRAAVLSAIASGPTPVPAAHSPLAAAVPTRGRSAAVSPHVVSDALPPTLTASRRAQLLRAALPTNGHRSTKVSRLRGLNPDSGAEASLFGIPGGDVSQGAQTSPRGATDEPSKLSQPSAADRDRDGGGRTPRGLPQSSASPPTTVAPYYASSTATPARAARGLGPLGLLVGAAGGDVAPSLAAQVDTLTRTAEEAWWAGFDRKGGEGTAGSSSVGSSVPHRSHLRDSAAFSSPSTAASAIAPADDATITMGGGDPSERSSNFFLRARRLLEALAVCVPRLGPLLDDAVVELGVAQRYAYETSLGARDLRRQLAALEASVEERLQSVRFECTRDVRHLSASLDAKAEALGVAGLTCDALRARLDEVTEARRAAAEQLRSYQGLVDRGRFEAVSLASQVQQLQDKSNVLIAENRYLRGLADHSAQLLQDVASLEARVDELKSENAELLRQRGARESP